MGGGVNPLEWLVPPVALTHMIVDQGASVAGAKIPAAPGSMTDKEQKLGEAAEAQRTSQRAAAEDERRRRAADLAARTETPAEALESKRRAGAANRALGSGTRRASQTLTEPGATLSGSY
jgi:hypothetical protein